MICYEIWEERSPDINHQRNSRCVAGYGFMRMFMMYLLEQNVRTSYNFSFILDLKHLKLKDAKQTYMS